MRCAEARGALVRFGHCGKAVYAFSAPARCPLCQQRLGPAGLQGAPVRIASPFADGHGERCGFLLRPARGSFLRDYDGKSDLHVGITNTNGVVYNYSQRGVQRDEAGWEQSLCVPLVQPSMLGLVGRWDKDLEDFSASDAWLPHRYDEEHHNCYSYALAFINRVLSTEGQEQLDRSEFTEKYVLPRTRLASKFISLHRAVEERGFCAVDHTEQECSAP